MKNRQGKPVQPKRRLCQDPNTKYCKGHKNSRSPYGHRGCCDCEEYNFDPTWDNPCNPYLLPENMAELKQWWIDNMEEPWDDSDNKYYRPKMKNRGGKK